MIGDDLLVDPIGDLLARSHMVGWVLWLRPAGPSLWRFYWGGWWRRQKPYFFGERDETT